jgi:xylan 1,4-beta-xylosidase
MLSYWTFSDVFEEQGVVKQPFYGGYGLIAENGLPKPSFNAFKLLHQLGDQRIAVDSNSALATKQSDGTVVIAIWNEFLPEETGEQKRAKVMVKGLTGIHSASMTRLDSTHGSVLSAYAAMGKPINPTQAQIQQLRRAAMLTQPETMQVHQGQVTIVLPPQGLALIEFH